MVNNVQFIAEISSNHNKDLDRCLKFIETSKNIGCDGIKFQLFKIDKLFAPEILNASPRHREKQNWELPLEFIPRLKQKCHELNLKFLCTPFYLEAVEELRPYVNSYKIASYELLWHDLLESCSKTKIPVILSTGMATIDEIDSAVEVIKSAGARDVTLLHCVSAYPALVEQCNLSAIKTLRDRYKCEVGWSDHSVKDSVIYRAVYKWNASMIEFHMDLDGSGEEFQIGHCWLPDQIAAVINGVKNGLNKEDDFTSADGNGDKAPVQSEFEDCVWRADPSDGLRPLLKIRKSWKK